MLARNALSSYRRHARGQLPSFSRLLTSLADAHPHPLPQIPRSKKPPRPIMNTAIILNRSPLITRTPSALERTYYAYQSRIQRALHNPFPYDFWFKQGSPLETRFRAEEMKRERNAFGKPFGMPLTDAEGNVVGPSYEDVKAQEEDEENMPRVHPSDTEGDVTSLDRMGQRNLYLLIKSKDDKEDGKEVWKFPQGEVEKGELLHEAAARDLTAVCGPYMDTWIVSRQPIGVYNPPSPLDGPKSFTFFYKAHILAGQVRRDSKQVLDFAWLTKEEMESRLENGYWLRVRDMLSDF